jgi:uncharacterized protein (DUF983 family)
MYSRDAVRTIGRGFRRRCPRCGANGLFRSWFEMRDECPRCAYRFQREGDDAFFLGALTLNFAFTEGVLGVLMFVAFAATLPDPPLGLIVGVAVPLMVVAPIAFYPTSRTLWAAVDFMLRSDER